MTIKMDFSDKTALVTGATRGIGAAISKHLRDAGADLILTGTDQTVIQRLNEEVRQDSTSGCRYVAVDFSNDRSLSNFLNMLENEQRIDICVNNAGINILNSVATVPTEDFDKVTNVNYRAPFLICRSVAEKMKTANFGRIVNIASIWSVITKANRVSYTAAKTGLVGMTRTLAVELAQYNILVNAVSPGFIKTELTDKNMPAPEQEALRDVIPIRRLGQPDEIARVVLFLASNLNTYISGQNIVVDGGFTNV